MSVVCAFGVVAACSASGEGTPGAETEGRTGPAEAADLEQPLLNGSSIGSWTCSARAQTYVSQWAFVARTVVTSRAFEQCVRARAAAKYVRCAEDPPGGVDAAIVAARNANPTTIRCSSTEDRAVWAAIEPNGNYNRDVLNFGKWLDDKVVSLVNDPSTRADDSPLRGRLYPWPTTEGASILAHEPMHSQGFSHWDAPGDPDCNPVNLSGYNMRDNSMPYIVGSCVNDVIERSQTRCNAGFCPTAQEDDLQSCEGRGALELVTDFDNAALGCSRHFDPAKRGVGALRLQNGVMLTTDAVPNGNVLGSSWRLGPDDIFWHRTSANLDPDSAGGEIMITSGWGAGVIGTDTNNRLKTIGLAPWESFATHVFNGHGTWVLRSGDVFSSAGRTSTQADYGAVALRDEILVRNASNSEWGLLAVVNGAFGTRGRYLSGSQSPGPFGHWTLGPGDLRYPAGDVDGDGRADVVVQSGWGAALLSPKGVHFSLETIDIRGNGDRFGGWVLSASDVIGPFGDFNGDGRGDFMIRSGWGTAIIGMPAGQTRLTTLWSAPWGSGALGGWTFTAHDAFLTTGRFHSTDRDSVLVTNPNSGMAVVTFVALTNLFAAVASGQKMAYGGRFPSGGEGDWALGTNNTIHYAAIGDYDGDGFDNFVISSPWGIGIIGRTVSSSTLVVQTLRARDCGDDPTDHACHGSLWGSWLARETDGVRASIKAGSGGALLLLSSATSD